MYYRTFFLGLCAWISMPTLGQENKVEDIRIGGYVGVRINTCIEHRVKSQDVELLVEPFRHREETSLWQSEFFGKWLLGGHFVLRVLQGSCVAGADKDRCAEFHADPDFGRLHRQLQPRSPVDQLGHLGQEIFGTCLGSILSPDW